MAGQQYDPSDFRITQEYATHLKSLYGERNSMYDQMEQIYFGEWAEEGTVRMRNNKIKITTSPDARNAIKGAIRLLISSDPVISVPYDQNQADAKEKSEALERNAAIMWRAASRVRGDPLHYDVIRSALIFDEFQIGITETASLVGYAKTMGGAIQARAEAAAEMTPILYDVYDPRSGYADMDPLGLRAHYRETQVYAATVREQYGKLAEAALAKFKDYDMVTLCTFYDLIKTCVWVQGVEMPIVQAEHGFPTIPVVVGTVEGSRLFSKTEKQREPFLYTLWKTGLWNRQNLALTVMYTWVFAIGANPMFVEKLNQAGQGVEVDWSRAGGKARVPFGADFYPMGSKGAIDPSILQALEIADAKAGESTIYSQVLGEPLSGNAPFSMVALLNQAGRLPLVTPQRKCSWGIGDALKKGLLIIKSGGRQAKAKFGGEMVTIKPGDIPDGFEIEAKLDVALPQDKLQNAMVADKISQGDTPLVSQQWTRENILNVGLNDAMQEEIWSERAAGAMFAKYLQDLMTPQAIPPGAPVGMPPGMAGPGMPPGAQMEMANPNQVGMTGMEGLPPEMALMGGQGPEAAPGMAPPDEEAILGGMR